MACAGDEYYFHGKCHKCQPCPPGQEPREECGYGAGVSSECVPCVTRWFKAEWGSHSCRKCQTCKHLNRQEVTPCTVTHNQECGDCLPGFYSKRRLDGLQDLECLPCGPATLRNTQCRSEGVNMEKVRSSDAPPLDAIVVTTTCLATVTMVTMLFVIMVLIYKGFSTIRKLYKGCLSSPGNNRCDIAAASVSVVTEPSVTQVFSDAYQSSTSPCSMTMTPNSLHHCSTSDLTSGFISQATGISPDIPENTDDLTTRGRHCAMEQDSSWGRHVPVECSELDFIYICPPLDFQTSAHTQKHYPPITHPSSSPDTRKERGREEEGERTGDRGE